MDDDDSDTVPDDFDQFDATLPLEDPVKHYRRLIDEKVRVIAFVPTEMIYNIWEKISAAAREAVWKLLFAETNPSPKRLELAAELLKEHRSDACFHFPDEYNEWMVAVRDELLERDMLHFWKNIIVAQELGPAWARDSDLFDDMDDPEPAKFYNFANCTAPWLMDEMKDDAMRNINRLTLNEEIKP